MAQIQRARNEAVRCLRAAGLPTIPVHVSEIAEQYASIRRMQLAEEISGMLIPSDVRPVIVVNSRHSPVRQRFTIAHELGHLLLHNFTGPHADQRFRFRDARSSDGLVDEEIEANQFAAELLMPRELVIRAVEDAGLEYAASEDEENASISKLARQFEVSSQAFSIRLATLQIL